MAPHPRVYREATPLQLDQRVKEQSTDPRCLELRKERDTNVATRYTDTTETLMVRVAPLDRTVQAYVPASLCDEVLTLAHDPARAGNPGVTKMYTSMRRAYYWEGRIADVHSFAAGCVE